PRLMNILPYKLRTTNDQLTSRAGLLVVAQMMEQLELSKSIDSYFPSPKSNRGIPASSYLETLILMQHEGSFHLDDVKHFHDDEALTQVLGIKQMPKASALGNWLRRMGNNGQGLKSLSGVNKGVLKAALHRCKGITLDIDATEIISHKADAQWTYNKNQGYMPMVGHIAEVGMVVACDFRSGNTPPAKDNLAFIQQCKSALPQDCYIKSLRIDAAGYQAKIIQYCEEQAIHYAIRAKMSAGIKEHIETREDKDWQPLIHKNGEASQSQSTCRTVHWMTDHETPLMLVIQRKAIKGQFELDTGELADSTEITDQGYIYRSIVTNQKDWTDSQIIHWYNQRGEASENRIKELKLDFGGDVLPCSDFGANALYFMISALSFNLLALMRLFLPEELAHHRAMTIRWRLYAIAAKVVKTGRQIFIKTKEKHHVLLEAVLARIRMIEPIAI
ncbi:MAG: IS1380 family transposase, partial [Methylococcales bacterium]|nr:IS1380 family transposase [Methylococcales bacterium]